MTTEFQGAFVNYYDVLDLPENASPESVRIALQTYRESQEMRLNNSLSMTAARQALNELLPAMERTLLDSTPRAEYNQRLADNRRKQQADYEPDDNEGLDDPLRIPFLFDPLEDFDTEQPAFTLRSLAAKLDDEWASARTWITDATDETHGFVSYLMFVANRKRLAERIEPIIEHVAPQAKEPMDVNEGIERCIDILNPGIERPKVEIQNLTFDGRTLDAGSFITDLPAQSELILGHVGVRGCAFGVVESQSSWLTFGNGRSSARFALMPLGTDARVGVSEVKIPLHFVVGNLRRNADHTARIIVRMENQVQPVEQLVPVQIRMLPLPPRVVFLPEATRQAPAYLGIVRRGTTTHATVTPRNLGDEAQVPLIGRISTKDVAARAHPYEFHTNEALTLTIDTSNRPYGEKYIVAFDIEYARPEAKGPTSIYVQGEILPTVWQSIIRTKRVSSRLIASVVGGFAGIFVLGFSTTELAAHVSFSLLLLLALPVLFLFAIRGMASTLIAHMQRAGNTTLSLKSIRPWALWGIPLALGLVLAGICMALSNAAVAFILGSLIGLLLGGTLGFLSDNAKSQNADGSLQKNI